MYENTCLICFAVNRRTLDIINTHLQQMYEQIAGFKIEDDSHSLCFICYTRLQQSYQLWQMIRRTQTVFKSFQQNSLKNQFLNNLECPKSLVELTTANVVHVSVLFDQEIKQEQEVKKEDQYEKTDVQVDELEHKDEFDRGESTRISYSEDDVPLYDIRIKQESETGEGTKTEGKCDDFKDIAISAHEATLSSEELLREFQQRAKSGNYMYSGFVDPVAYDKHKEKHDEMTIEDVGIIKQGRHNLQSTLVMKCFDNDDCNLQLSDDLAKQDQEPLDEEELDREELESEQELEEKDENIFVEEHPGGVFESDDDSQLSEEYKKRARKGKVKPDKEVRVAEEEDNPTSTMDRYKLSSVRRRKTHDALGESLFTVCTLTYDEQIVEIRQRAESSGYRLARYKCTVCYRGFHIRHKYDAHVVRHSEQYGAYECSICKSRLRTANALRKHITALHTKKYSCKDCPFETKNRGMSRQHERWHAGTKYQCPHCPSEFDKMSSYLGHIRIKHVSNFVCELCGYTFVSQKGIDLHKKLKHRLADKTLSLDGPYCAECNVRFVSEEAHARHLKLSSQHSSDDDPNRLRNDSQCMKTERNGRMMLHRERRRMEVDTAEPVICEQCGIELRNLRLYALHFRRVHPDKNRTKFSSMKSPCMCEQCGQIFRSSSLLKDHMQVHTNAGAGEKRFKCDLCDKSFTHKTNLVTHKHLHSGSRPSYECPVCGKHFAFFKNRRRHMFTHSGLKPFKCDTCSKCFSTAGEQRSHVEHVHLKKPWPKRARTRAHPGRED